MKPLRLFLANLGWRSASTPALNPPLGILSLAAYVRSKQDVDVCLADQRAERLSLEALVSRAADFRADVVGLSVLTPFAFVLPSLTRMFRDALPNVWIVAGGAHAPAMAPRDRDRDAPASIDVDAIVVGEGERVLEQILAAYPHRDDLRRVPGLIWRDRDGHVTANSGAMPPIEDLDSLPFPAYDLIDLAPYHKGVRMSQVPPGRYMSLFTSRGCPYRCWFCHEGFGKGFRSQSAARIVAEIEHCERTYGIRDFDFLDDSFNLDEARVLEFSHLLMQKNRRPALDFANGLRGDRLSVEMVDALCEAGMYRASLGIETGSPRLQALIGKRLDIAKVLDAAANLARRRVFTHAFAMLGLPTETESELRGTIDLLSDSSFHTAAFFRVVPFPGTALYRWAQAECPEKMAGISYDNTDYGGAWPWPNLSAMPDEVLEAWRRSAWSRFYLRPRRLARILRDYPRPEFLPRLLPLFLQRVTGRIGLKGDRHGGRTGDHSAARGKTDIG